MVPTATVGSRQESQRRGSSAAAPSTEQMADFWTDGRILHPQETSDSWQNQPWEEQRWQQPPSHSETAKEERERKWAQFKEVAIDWWFEQDKRARHFGNKPLSHDETAWEQWDSLTTDQLAYVVQCGNLLQDKVPDKPGANRSAAYLFKRLQRYHQLFPEMPQSKGQEKGRAKRPAPEQDNWRSKVMKTEVGQQMQERMEKLGRCKGKGKSQGKQGKDRQLPEQGKGKGKSTGVGSSPPAVVQKAARQTRQ